MGTVLVEFAVTNFLSFREEQRLSMVAAPKHANPESLIETPALGKEKLLKSAVIYGPNASGKSNLFKALRYLCTLVATAPDSGPAQPGAAQPFGLSRESLEGSSRFDLVFIHEGIRYEYQLVVAGSTIEEETLYASPRGRSQRWYRRWHDANDGVRIDIGGNLKGAAALAKFARKDVPFLSVAARFNNPQLVAVQRWFAEHCTVVFSDDLATLSVLGGSLVAQLVESAPKLHPALLELLRQADLGIEGFSIRERASGPIDLRQLASDTVGQRAYELLPPDAKEFVGHYRDREVLFQHGGEAGTGLFTLADESRGTVQLFTLGPLALACLQRGRLIVVDELDASLHPRVVRALVRMFHQENPHNAQLLFNTHDTSLLRGSLFDRDQVWFMEKDRAGASQLYSLFDFRAEARENWEAGYLAGRYGAIPLLDYFLLRELRHDAAAS